MKRRRWRGAVILSLLFLIAFPSGVFAATLSGESRTYIQSRETLDSTRITPFFEYLDFTVGSMGREELSFHFGGWLRWKEQEQEGFAKNLNSDLQYAYFSFKNNRANTIVNLGRVFVSEGVALEQIDGIYARTDLKAGFGIAAFGGVPVETDFDNRSSDYVVGGRLTHEIPGIYRVGLSYLNEGNHGANYREEEGIDLWVRPLKNVDILGRSTYNSLNSGWMENTYYASLGPFYNFRITPQVSSINYRHYFTSFTTTAFDFLTTTIDPNEKVLILGGDVAYSLNDNLTFSALYRNYNYDIAGSANYFGGKVAYRDPTWGGGISFYRMDGSTDRLRYNEYRAYATTRIGKADFTADLLNVKYDVEINGVQNAYAVVVAAGYNITKKARIGADFEYGRNPFYHEEIKTLFKFVYLFDVSPGQNKGGNQ